LLVTVPPALTVTSAFATNDHPVGAAGMPVPGVLDTTRM